MTRELRDHQLSARIPRRIFALMEEQAERERRTVADVLNNLLEERYPAQSSREGARRR
jgi:hypothetical protein